MAQTGANFTFDSAGNLLVAGGGGAAATQVQGTAAAGAAPVGNPVYIAGLDTNTTVRPFKTDVNGNLFVVGASNAPLFLGPQSASGVLGALNDAVTLATANGAANIIVQYTGTTPSLVVTYEGSNDGTNWVAIQALLLPIGAAASRSSATTNPANGSFYTIFTEGFKQVRVRCSIYTSGSITANLSTFTEGQANYTAIGGQNASAALAMAGIVGTSTDTNAHNSVSALLSGAVPFLLNAGNQFERGRAAKVDGSAVGTVGVPAGALHAWDGAAYSACKVESSTNPNLRINLYNGATANTAFASATDSLGNGAAGIVVYPYNLGFNGSAWERLRAANVFKVVSLGAGTAETTIWTPTAGKKFRLMGFLLTCGVASTLTFKDNTAGTTIAAARGTADQPINWEPPNSNGILSAAANNVLTVTRGTSATLDGIVYGTEE